MLLGPDAPVEVLPERAHHMMNCWDFYKPVGWKDNFPLMRDGAHSIDCYMQCLDGCQERLTDLLLPRAGGEEQYNLVEANDYFVAHCTSVYLCKRAFKRICENAFAKTGEKLPLQKQMALFTQKVLPTIKLTKRIGSR